MSDSNMAQQELALSRSTAPRDQSQTEEAATGLNQALLSLLNPFSSASPHIPDGSISASLNKAVHMSDTATALSNNSTFMYVASWHTANPFFLFYVYDPSVALFSLVRRIAPDTVLSDFYTWVRFWSGGFQLQSQTTPGGGTQSTLTAATVQAVPSTFGTTDLAHLTASQLSSIVCNSGFVLSNVRGVDGCVAFILVAAHLSSYLFEQPSSHRPIVPMLVLLKLSLLASQLTPHPNKAGLSPRLPSRILSLTRMNRPHQLVSLLPTKPGQSMSTSMSTLLCPSLWRLLAITSQSLFGAVPLLSLSTTLPCSLLRLTLRSTTQTWLSIQPLLISAMLNSALLNESLSNWLSSGAARN